MRPETGRLVCKHHNDSFECRWSARDLNARSKARRRPRRLLPLLLRAHRPPLSSPRPPRPRCSPPCTTPAPTQRQYYQSFPEFKRRRAELADRAFQLLTACEPLARRGTAGRPAKPPPDASATGGAGGASEDEEERDERAAALAVEIADDVLERADRAMDAAAELRQEATALPLAARPGAAARGGAASVAGGGRAARGLQRYSAALARPQDAFEEPVDNSNAPFVPWVHDPALKGGAPSSSAAATTTGGGSHPHPYAAQLDTLVYQPWQLEAPEPTPAGDLDATPVTFVDTPAQLAAMMEALRGAREVAIDLEHHSYRWGRVGAPLLTDPLASQHDAPLLPPTDRPDHALTLFTRTV
jgi:hypothetical protein